MKTLRRLLTAILAVACITTATAQTPDDVIEQILEKSRTQRVTLDYTCSISDLSPVTIKGKLIIQGDCYFAEGHGMRIYCNGDTRWTVDTGSKEVYIENAGGTEEVLQYRDSVTRLKISNVKYSEPSDGTEFIFDTSALDSSWVTTDLR